MERDENKIYIMGKTYTRLPKGTEKARKLKELIAALNKKLIYLERIKNKEWYPDYLMKRILSLETDEVYTPEIFERVEEIIKDTKEDIAIYQLLLEDEQKKYSTHKTLRRKIKKRTNAQIKEAILKIINERSEDGKHECSFITKENIARILQVKECQVEQVFMELNREGILSKPVHHAPHDSQRDPWGFSAGFMGWQGDIYYIRNKEKEKEE